MFDVPTKDLLEERSGESHCGSLRPGIVQKVSDLVVKTHFVGCQRIVVNAFERTSTLEGHTEAVEMA